MHGVYDALGVYRSNDYGLASGVWVNYYVIIFCAFGNMVD